MTSPYYTTVTVPRVTPTMAPTRVDDLETVVTSEEHQAQSQPRILTSVPSNLMQSELIPMTELKNINATTQVVLTSHEFSVPVNFSSQPPTMATTSTSNDNPPPHTRVKQMRLADSAFVSGQKVRTGQGITNLNFVLDDQSGKHLILTTSDRGPTQDLGSLDLPQTQTHLMATTDNDSRCQEEYDINSSLPQQTVEIQDHGSVQDLPMEEIMPPSEEIKIHPEEINYTVDEPRTLSEDLSAAKDEEEESKPSDSEDVKNGRKAVLRRCNLSFGDKIKIIEESFRPGFKVSLYKKHFHT